MADDEQHLFEDEDEPNKDAERRNFIAAIERLRMRCENAKIPVEERPRSTGENYIVILLPSGRETRRVPVSFREKAEALESVRFEDYIVLAGYEAICSYSAGTIEALIDPIGFFTSSSDLYGMLFGMDIRDAIANRPRVLLKPAGIATDVALTIGFPSNECYLLTNNFRVSSTGRALSVTITGLKVSQHDKAIEYLERIADSLFFEIELSRDISLALMRARKTPEHRIRTRTPKESELTFPRFEYDHEAVSLYWYARHARGMPLLEFLAYYQAIEVFFPNYSQIEAHKRVRNILKDPSFNPFSDSDVGRIFKVIKVNKNNRGFGDERSQLKAVIEECVTADSLRHFLTSDSQRADFYKSKQKTISDHRIPVASPDVDLRNDVVARIYDIRCKIVHTKDTGEGDQDTATLLLPFSKEAEALTYDIELVQYLARQVLIASSTAFRVDA